jgi:hypothetical protein
LIEPRTTNLRVPPGENTEYRRRTGFARENMSL